MSKRGKKILVSIIIVVLVLIGLYMGYIYYVLSSLKQNEPQNNNNNENNIVSSQEIDWNKKINILLIGVDARYLDEICRSDTNILVSIDPVNKKIFILSLPRDMMVVLPGYEGVQKLAHAHAYGGVPLLIETVEQELGIDVPYYVKVNFDGFKKMIDMLGGITIDVEKDMDYDSYLGDVHIHLKKGLQHLNGEKALEYVRFRMDETGDIGRMKRQQKFLKELAKEALSIKNTIRMQKILLEMKNWVETNLKPWQVIKLGILLKSIKDEDIETMTVPGHAGWWEDGLSYYFADRDKLEEIVNKYLRDDGETP